MLGNERLRTPSGDKGPARAAGFIGINAMDYDSKGNLYLLDSAAGAVRWVKDPLK